MNIYNKIFILIILAIVFCSPVLAQSGHMTLLAVAQDEFGEYTGSVADLELTIKPGEGRVYLETFPLSKIDTQISTRFAKEVACKFLEKDCNRYDFFYTIRSKASIIGGPSAGGAIAVLTAAVLDKQKINQDITMSGTINSGDLIGPVGHLHEKIEAAKEHGLKKVLIPSGQKFQELKNENKTINLSQTVNETNITREDLIELGSTLNITVVEVIDLNDALFELTGKQYNGEVGELIISSDYTKVMKDLATDLCHHAYSILDEINTTRDKETKELTNESFMKRYKLGTNLTNMADEAFENQSYYSAASFCFSASVEFRRMLYFLQELNETEILNLTEELKEEINKFDLQIESKSRNTITDLQAYMIVKERMLEAREALDSINNNSNILAYVKERFYSAGSWSKFFGVPGKMFELSESDLKDSCMEKLNEVDERVQFVEIFFPSIAGKIRDNFELAYEYFLNEEYALCLFKASKTKAEANVLVSVVGVDENEFDKVLENKFLSAKKAITRQTAIDVFPIIAYSYYEYGSSLKPDDKYSALVYAEYALELSNLDMYFEQKKPFEFAYELDLWKIWLLVIGIIIGFILGRISLKKKVIKMKKSRVKIR